MTPLPQRAVRLLAIAIAATAIAAPSAGAQKPDKPKKRPVPSAIAVSTPAVIFGQGVIGSATATCPKGTQAVAGGFAATPPTPGVQLVNPYESQRAGTRGWRVSGVQMHPAQGELTAYASCEAIKSKVKTRSVTVPLAAPGSTVTGLARCPGGTKVVGGGFSVPPATSAASSLVSRSILGNGIGWVVDATRLAGADTGSLIAYSYCAKVGKIKTKSASAAVLGSTGTQTATTPACPGKTPLRGGGFATSTPVNGLAGSALVFESRPEGGTWRSAASPGSGTAKSTLVSNSYCRA